MSNVVVVGLQWGDEAKGKVVDFLSQDAEYVVRFNGGNNAGHTVVVGKDTYKFHAIPVGVLNPDAIALITDGVVLDLGVFAEELRGLRERGITADKIKVSGNVHIIMPWHKRLDALEEAYKKDGKVGTTGRGIGPCYADKASRIGLRIYDIIDPEALPVKLREVLRLKNDIITKVYGGEPFDYDEILEQYTVYGKALRPYVADTATMLFEATSDCRKILFEAAQGALLDIDQGTYPFVTSSHSISGGATLGTGVGPTAIDYVIGVAKAYTTRVGAGPMPTELFDDMGDVIRENGHEYGTTTGRPRRCGWFDAVCARYSCRINGCTSVAVCLLDVLNMPRIKICTKYEIDGCLTDVFPTKPELLAKARPVYEELEGWNCDVSGIRSFRELPEKCRAYVRRVEELMGCRICMVSVGPKRDQSIIIDRELLSVFDN